MKYVYEINDSTWSCQKQYNMLQNFDQEENF